MRFIRKSGEAIAVKADVTDENSISRAFDLVVDKWGTLTIGVNNAGISIWSNSETQEKKDWDKVMNLNLTGVYLCCRKEAQLMIGNGYGKIINTASMSGHIVNTPQNQAAYNTSKAGVLHLSKSLAAEWAPKGIRVNTISPGYTKTKLVSDLLETEIGKEMSPVWMEKTPVHKMLDVTDLQGGMVFLASPASDFMTGADYPDRRRILRLVNVKNEGAFLTKIGNGDFMNIESTITQWSKVELQDKAYESGREYEKKCAFCPQASIAALMDVFQIKDDDLFRAAYGFHGGGGDRGIGTCGALCGGILIISYFFGRSRLEFNFGKENRRATDLVGKLVDEFKKEFDGVSCNDVQKKMFGRSFNNADKAELDLFLEMGGHTEKCPKVVGRGAALAAGIIWDELERL